jgi:hypothetical protein
MRVKNRRVPVAGKQTVPPLPRDLWQEAELLHVGYSLRSGWKRDTGGLRRRLNREDRAGLRALKHAQHQGCRLSQGLDLPPVRIE